MKDPSVSSRTPHYGIWLGIAAVCGGLFVWGFLRYGLAIILPFLLAWLLSVLLSPLAERLGRALRLPRRISAGIVTLAAILLFSVLLTVSVNRILKELGTLFRFLSDHPETVEEALASILTLLSDLSERIPLLSAIGKSDAVGDLFGDVEGMIRELFRDTVASLTASIPNVLLRTVRAIPSILLFSAAFLIAAFYFAIDGERIRAGVLSVLPESVGCRLAGLREKTRSLLCRCLRAYFLLFLVTFAQLLIGFLLLEQPYAFLIALLSAAVDALPILGVGSVLVPWAVVLFFMHRTGTAVGLLILWGVILIVRQILEPRLIGSSLGLHPLLTLMAVYAGIRLFGFSGLFLGPCGALLLRTVLREIRDRSARGQDGTSRCRKKPEDAKMFPENGKSV
jgi:sporulation integral membrane protein YtvI